MGGDRTVGGPGAGRVPAPDPGVAAFGAGERVGIFGGTFDPVHIGHLVAATWARDALALDQVLMVVANEPWQKTHRRRITPAQDRLAVVAAAVHGVPGLVASGVEIDRGGPSYTIDTVRELADTRPGATFFLVVGADVADDLDTWHEVDELAARVTLVVVDRGGVGPSIDRAKWRLHRLRIPAIDVSSSELRERLAGDRSVDFLIPEPAILCIRRLGLYAGHR